MSTHVITCGCCFNVLREPVTLACKHTFCSSCVRASFGERGEGLFQCPLCATPHTELHAGNLGKFSDHEAEVYVEALEAGASDPAKCQWCEAAAAAVQCAECMNVYCDACCTAVHRNSAKRQHAIGKLSEASRSFPQRCPLRGHEEYRAEFYCLQCRQVCCAYCLQVGPHREHQQVPVAVAAADARQQMARDLQAIVENKGRVERQAAELNRVSAFYADSYDTVENLVTERFEMFKQQLLQRELEVRRTLAKLREGGDAALTSSRLQYLDSLNRIHEAFFQFRSLQSGGSDVEVLLRHSHLDSYLTADVPSVAGSGFKLTSVGEMALVGMEIELDLQTVENNRPTFTSVNRTSTYATSPTRSSAVSFSNRVTHSTPLRLTFPVDDDVEATVLAEGVRLRCVAQGGSATQIGVRSKEVFQALLVQYPEDRGMVTWQIRLDAIVDSFVGVVEKTSQSSEVPEALYWKPASGNVVDGQIGRFTSAVRRLPPCRNGDRIRFVYDGVQGTLRIIINESDDRGIVAADVNPHIAACFIFYPGEALTVLFSS